MHKMYHNGQMVNMHADVNFLFPVYEVIRVVDGKIHFLDEHLRRLERSWSLSDRFKRKDYIGYERLAEICRKVVKENEVENQNIRIDIDGASVVVKPVESFYPSAKEYEAGVDTISEEYVRINPNAKISNILLTERAKQIRSIENVFEILLVNEDGQILEGSKSNVFFMKGAAVYTAPTDQILGGVTREILVNIIHEVPELKLYMKPVNLKDIFKYDCCFLTGTSIDLLPIRRVDSQTYHSASNPYFKMLLSLYREYARHHAHDPGRLHDPGRSHRTNR